MPSFRAGLRVLVLLAAGLFGCTEQSPVSGGDRFVGDTDRRLVQAVLATDTGGAGQQSIRYPTAGTLYPRDLRAPLFQWEAMPGASQWLLRVQTAKDGTVNVHTREPRWRPQQDDWEFLKKASLGAAAQLQVWALDGEGRAVARGESHFTTSPDPVAASIFYRVVPIPFPAALADLTRLEWRVADPASYDPARTLLAKSKQCLNCHSFSADGKTFAIEIDYKGSKTTSVAVPIEDDGIARLRDADVIDWSRSQAFDKDLKDYLLLSAFSNVSPKGDYLLASLNDSWLLLGSDDLHYSQLATPMSGILAYRPRASGPVRPLPGADDANWIQTNPSWSPDQGEIAFARAAFDQQRFDKYIVGRVKGVRPEVATENRKVGIHYDIYTLPFNNGAGGTAQPLAGASGNGRSNYFARYSPDGKWIAFTQSAQNMVIQPDSDLYIVSAQGGTARRLNTNSEKMDSWHSWSPNSRWLVFSSKRDTPYTQLFLTHIDEQGRDSPAFPLEHMSPSNRAANLPVFVNTTLDRFRGIEVAFAPVKDWSSEDKKLFTDDASKEAAGAAGNENHAAESR